MKTRRDFLKTSALATAATVAGSIGSQRFAFGQTAGGKTLIKVFMRGGADGLHLFPAVGDMQYFMHRPNIAIEAPSNDPNSAINIGDSYRGMNPNLLPLMEIWDAGRMMVCPATQFAEANRSHFDSQRWIGTGARNNLIDGYLNRYMQSTQGVDSPLRGVVAGKGSLSTEARGQIVIPVIQDGGSFNVTNPDFCSGNGCADNRLTELMAEIASHEVDLSAIEGAVRENQGLMVETIDSVQAASADYTPNAGGMDYTNSDVGRGLRLCAQLIKAGIPLEVAALDWNIGWDTHSNQIADGADRFIDQDKGYHRNMRSGANNFVTFFRDMGDLMDDIVVIVGSEFGRTVIENGSTGTDHGYAGAWFAFGGPTQPGVGPDISSLAVDQLQDERYVPLATDYRDIVAEIMVRHMGMAENLVSTVFPNHSFTNNNLFAPVA